jgi:uncharacterized protein
MIPRSSWISWMGFVNLVDVNVLIYARRKDAERHLEYRAWLTLALGDPKPLAVASQSLVSAVRILTNRSIWRVPLTLDESLEYAEIIRSAPAAVLVEPGKRHWGIFDSLCRSVFAHGNLVMDAWLAALAIEHGCTLVTTDRDFARFPGLAWKHPLA